ncbi:MAG: sigma 54-interacting transcriptional regulator [Deltaproteobacteria bacterium]|nr:sigma 54-interacting transcriptional regulator [Deltaproteobacteria bacterium]
MVHVHVLVNGQAPVIFSLAAGETALLGRLPSPDRLLLGAPLGALRVVPLAGEQVSANHALVGCDEAGLWVRDLRTRNGTLVLVPPETKLRLPGPDAHLHVAPEHHPNDADAPLLAEPWSSVEDFDRAIVSSARRFLEGQGLDLEVRVTSSTAPGGEPGLRLATGALLVCAAPAGATLDLRAPAALEQLAAFVQAQNQLLDDERLDDGLIARAPRFREAVRRTREAARRGARTLLLGPSGSGKERLAAVYHRHSPRVDGPFRALNCAVLSEELLWVQLFGAARGSFTGAVRDLPGALDAAEGGTLFLDELGEISPRVQAALLRFLDRGEYERLGETRVRRASVQLVGATNADLRDATARGAFRADLWYRFAAAVIDVPPLRERPEDILAFLEQRPGGGLSLREALHGDALSLLLAHDWPGNFRELENLSERLPRTSRRAGLGAETVAGALAEGTVRPSSVAPTAPSAARPSESWEAVFADATAAWRAEQQGPPETLGQVRAFVEDYLKPAFVAASAGVAQGARVEQLNLSAVGRRLDILDGTTVRRLLERYLAHQVR